MLVLVVGGGCASRWSMRTEKTPVAMQWPFQPANAKVTYEGSITGFAQGSSSASVLKTIAGSGAKNSGLLLLPVAVATTPDGRIAVADIGRRCVHFYEPTKQRYLRISVAGKEKIQSPVGLIFDAESRLFVSDSAGRLFIFDPDGSFLAASTFRRPTGLAYSPVTRLVYVVDTVENQVVAVNSKGEVAFSFGSRGSEAGKFNYPTHIFRSSVGQLYITDALNFRVQIFDEQGKYLSSFGHHGDGSGDFAMPKGIAVDKDDVVYVVDSLFDNVQLFNRSGQFLLTIGKRGGGFGEFWLPGGLFINEKDTLYVCDTYNRRIQVFQISEHYENML